ncbi:family 43 glycosylhydrolase [Pontibacter qinzhouensis]|uniref:Family 43 glycosylhydrolase n=1 Tax=Pontibacter qinzhouensis TaxID=2603253 RepID=A0A5C8K809_9BACT|nr:glycoside hydrolase family 43 protein [Pontibacter qinzhouensis]TXK49103.1 family 43 glycosylhydrolase [Pontibacter qinzhouensis]
MKHTHTFLLAFCCFLLCSSAGCKKETDPGQTTTTPPPSGPETTFSNPLLPSGPDPWVAQKDSFYYYTHTLGNRIGLAKTKHMSQLKEAPLQTVWTPPALGLYSRNLWAPELHRLDGKWYVYFAADGGQDVDHRMYVIENASDDPTTGTWEFKGKISDTSDKWAIDGTVLEYNGERYFLWSGWRGDNDPGIQQLYIARMSNPWTLVGERVMLSEPVYPWERNGFVNEGPQILKNKDGRVFMIYSASGCWTDDYTLGMMTLKEGGNPLLPSDWSKHPNPVFSKRPASNAYGPGHNGFFTSPDGTEDWIIYHANPSPGQGCSGSRSPRIQKFTWNADGTPNFGEPVPLSAQQTRPSGEVK